MSPSNYKTPGVYVKEVNASPNSIVQLATSIPAFIGYTEKSMHDGNSLLNKPVRISSFLEFEFFYGKGCNTTYNLKRVTVPSETPLNYEVYIQEKAYGLIVDKNTRFNLYDAMKLFYQNGGGSCFIVSVGTYGNNEVVPNFSSTPFMAGISALEKETEPTMLIIPDAVLLDAENCYSLQEQMLMHCEKFQNKVAVLDIHSGDNELDDINLNPIDNFRNAVPNSSFGAAYYPWLNTTILQREEINYANLNDASRVVLRAICDDFVNKHLNEQQAEILKPHLERLLSISNLIRQNKEEIGTSNSVLNLAIPDYKLIMVAILKKKNVLPPAAAMAGIYTMVDSQRGAWKAPANVTVNSVTSPVVLINDAQQEDLNTPLSGKSVCAIRSFIGRGNLVWGARTLDGNSNDYRYINVRRTMIMIEQSIKLALKAYVFEANDNGTWVVIKTMISNFLTNLWKQGALAGAKPEDAFGVKIGLGATMTSVDLLEGNMRVEIYVALMRPAEFIVISFEQQMQKS